MSSVQELTAQMVKKIEEVSHLLRKKREFIKWTKFLNRNIRMIRRLIKNKVYSPKLCFKLESNLALLVAYKEKFKSHAKKI